MLTVKKLTELLTKDQNYQFFICAGPKNPKDKVYDQKGKMAICLGPILALTLNNKLNCILIAYLITSIIILE